MYDLIIIGAGPAGITAGVYAARKRMSVLVVSRDIGGQAAISGDVENYTGYQFITGPELAQKFEEHIRKFDIILKENETIEEIKKAGDKILVKTDKASYETRTAIIASGKRLRQLNMPGEKEFRNKGVSYCATCDAPLFSGKNVAIIGGGNSALDAALQLIKIARHVYIINITANIGGDAIMLEKINECSIVTVMNNTQVISVFGEKMVTGIQVKTEGNLQNLAVEGVFIEIGLMPNSEFVSSVEKNKFGEIKVDGSNQTNIPGIFAAGDVTDVPEKQIIIAAGEGAKAALGTFKYLSQHK
jgi:alkyl hydroperoxide reductase subunit F